MFDSFKKGFYWAILIGLSFLCIMITIKLLYYLFIILAAIGLAVVIKKIYENGR